MLTSTQKELLLFINERLKESGVPPSYDEMKEALDLRSSMERLRRKLGGHLEPDRGKAAVRRG